MRAMSGSMPVVSQSIMNAIVPVGASTRDLRVAVAVLLAELERLVPDLRRASALSRSAGTPCLAGIW